MTNPAGRLPGFAARPRTAADGILTSAARGAGLIGLAVIVGIVLLQVVDDGASGPAGNGGGGGNAGGGVGDTTATTTAPTDGGQPPPPAQVRVLVLNAGQPAGAAQNKANQLRTAGYNTLPAGNAPERAGVAVQCKPGFEDAAPPLALAVGEGAQSEDFDPNAPPPGAENADCIVLLGQV
jgi:hypothetical protein